jgi:hypothetical protein
MFSRSIVDHSGSINDTPRVVIMMIVSDAQVVASLSDNSTVVIYNHNMFIIQATDVCLQSGHLMKCLPG